MHLPLCTGLTSLHNDAPGAVRQKLEPFAGLWQGARNNFSSAISQHGTHLILRQGDDLSLCQLQPEQQTVRFRWANNDSQVLICFSLCDSKDPRAGHRAGVLEVLYLFHLATQTLQSVACSESQHYYVDACFGPSERLILAWGDMRSDHIVLDFYETCQCQRVARLHTGLESGWQGEPYGCSILAVPDGQLFAVTSPCGREVHLFDGCSCEPSKRVLPCHDYEEGYIIASAFSPTGSQLAMAHVTGQVGGVHVHILDVASGAWGRCFGDFGDRYPCDEVFRVHVSCSSLLVLSTGQHARQCMTIYSIKPQRVLEQTGNVAEMAVSPDSVFVAAICTAGDTPSLKDVLRIYQLATGNLLHTFGDWQLPGKDASAQMNVGGPDVNVGFALQWARVGLRLFVSCHIDDFHNGQQQAMFTFAF